MADNNSSKPEQKMFIQLSKESLELLRSKNLKIVNNGLLPLNSSLKFKSANSSASSISNN